MSPGNRYLALYKTFFLPSHQPEQFVQMRCIKTADRCTQLSKGLKSMEEGEAICLVSLYPLITVTEKFGYISPVKT